MLPEEAEYRSRQQQEAAMVRDAQEQPRPGDVRTIQLQNAFAIPFAIQLGDALRRSIALGMDEFGEPCIRSCANCIVQRGGNVVSPASEGSVRGSEKQWLTRTGGH